MEQNIDLKQKLSNKNALMKLQIENLNKSKIEMDKLKDEFKRLKEVLNQKEVDLD